MREHEPGQQPVEPRSNRFRDSLPALVFLIAFLVAAGVVGFFLGRGGVNGGTASSFVRDWLVPAAFIATAIAALISATIASSQTTILERSFQSQGGPILKINLLEGGIADSEEVVLIDDAFVREHCSSDVDSKRLFYLQIINIQSSPSGVAFDVYLRCKINIPKRGTPGERHEKPYKLGPFTVQAEEESWHVLIDLGAAPDFVLDIDAVEYKDIYGNPIYRAFGDCRLEGTNTGELHTRSRVLMPSQAR